MDQAEFDNKVAQLQGWPRPQMAAEFTRLWDRHPPFRISNQMLRRAIEHKWYEQAFGGLSEDEQRLLAKLIKQFKKNPNSLFKQTRQIKSGTQLRRLWKGEVHEVTVKPNGFSYDNELYGSLSEVARIITGTRWNGPLFFGIRQPKKEAA